MNKKQIVASLNKIANELDNSGLFSESSAVTKVMSRLAFSADFDAEKYRKSIDNEGMAVSDLMDPEGTSNPFDDEYSRYKDINVALDELEKAIRDSESMSDAAKDKAREHMQNIKRLSNEILANGF
jgi:methyl-accepting chemotaxis protein